MGSGKSGGKQARAIREEGERQAARDRLKAQLTQQQQEQMIKLKAATEAASVKLQDEKAQNVEVEQAPVEEVVVTDEEGRKRAPREAYRLQNPRTSGIMI